MIVMGDYADDGEMAWARGDTTAYPPICKKRGIVMHEEINLDVVEGSSKRQDCPYCGGINTLVVSKRLGSIVYMCHRAGCNKKGYIENQSTVEDFKPQPEKRVKNIKLSNFKSVSIHTNAMAWLEKYNFVPWQENNKDKIKYDIIENRVVFLIEEEGKIVDAVGAYLGTVEKQPKWKRYAASGLPFVAKSCTGTYSDVATAVVVEDAASACAVSTIITGVALMGVNTTTKTLLKLSDYHKVFVALDRDALNTTWKVAKTINQVVDTEVLVLDKDLKYYNREELIDFFEGL